MKAFWLVLFSILLLACGPDNFIYKIPGPNDQTIKVAPIYLDEDWTDAERASLHKAINDWNYALNGKVYLDVEDEHHHVNKSSPKTKLIIIKIDSKIANRNEEYISLAWTHGRGTGIGGDRIYIIRDRIKDDDLQYVALHEIGHALGSDHVNYKGLMDPEFDRDNYKCIDKVAIKQVATYQHISMDGLRWCR